MAKLILKHDYEKRGEGYVLLKDKTYKTGVSLEYAVNHCYFTISKNGEMWIKKLYFWDGATGGIDTKDFMRGSLIHDVFCQAIKEGLLDIKYRKDADKVLKRIILEDGMSGIRAFWVYNFVRGYARMKYLF